MWFQQKSYNRPTDSAAANAESRLSEYEASFEEANASAKAVLKYEASHPSFTGLMEKIATLIPQDTLLTRLSTKDYKVFLTGTAQTRDGLLQFQENLKNDPCFESVNAPLSNLFSEQNVAFEIDFTVTAECLQGNGF